MKFFFGTYIIYLYEILVGKSSKNILINKKIIDDFKKNKIAVIYSFWHNRIFYLPYLYRKSNIAVMVSLHKDGELIARVMKKLGLVAIRGSTTRGGIRALVNIIKYIKENNISIAFTPDGPKGPKYEIQEGVLLAAQKSKAPIVPICWNCKKKKILNSWDNFILPYPFNTFVTVYGNPIWINDNDSLELKKIELKKEMMRIVDIADNYF